MNREKLLAIGRVLLAVALFLCSRINERSTWAVGAPALLTLLGLNIQPDQAEAIATVGVLIAGGLGSLVPDGKLIDLSPLDRDRFDEPGGR